MLRLTGTLTDQRVEKAQPTIGHTALHSSYAHGTHQRRGTGTLRSTTRIIEPRDRAKTTVPGKERDAHTYQDLARHVLIGRAGAEVDEEEHEDGGREEKREDTPPPREGPDLSVQDLVSLAGLPVLVFLVFSAFRGRRQRDTKGGGVSCAVVGMVIDHA